MTLLARIARLFTPTVTAEEIRMEVYLLGSRHRGEPLGGAILELQVAGLAPGRSRLLHAVIDHLSGRSAPSPRPVSRTMRD
ncbi:MAG: hypothetical protein ACHP84_08295 [Caulobacterales bacterium]